MSNAKNKHRNIRKGGHVKTVRYHDLLRAKRTQNPLSGLNPAKVRRLYELYREGKYADVQLAWDALEEYDDMLGTVLNRVKMENSPYYYKYARYGYYSNYTSNN